MELCHSCSVGLPPLRTSLTEGKKRSTSFYFLQSVKKSVNCSFCCLMLRILSRDLEVENLESGVIVVDREILASYTTKSGVLRDSQSCEEIAICRLWLYLRVEGAGSLTRNRAGTIYGYGIQLLADENEGDESRFLKGRLLNQTCDVELIKMWIRTCVDEHGMLCTPTDLGTARSRNRVPFTLKVIDIEQQCVVEAPQHCRYVALSYTWGTPDVPQLKLTSNSQGRLFAVGGLSDSHVDIPTTIKDAMTLCGMLEVKYLWVDALCIKQDHKEDVTAQLANMDLVYGAAFLTIVSGEGHDSWAGLPGVHPTSRNVTQFVESVQGLKLVSTQMPFVPAVNQSGWNGRGWTFQERALSKRLLIFTKHQVFFSCNAALWWEDTILESKAPMDIKWNHMQDASQQHHYKNSTADLFTQYKRLVQGYTSRALTYEEDALNAISGVLTSLTASEETRYYKGILESHLDVALLFHRHIHKPLSRRKTFPTWSWVGWEGQSVYQNDAAEIVSEVRWYRYHSKAEMTWFHEIDTACIKKANETDGFETLRALWKPVAPAPRTRPALPIVAIPNTPLLVFETSAAFFVVDMTGKETERSFGNELCNIRCPHDQERIIGQIRIHHQWRSERSQSKLEFIVIARVVLQYKGEEMTGLWTMLIETDERGISQRVQLPVDMIKDADWAAAKPSWRTVYLA